MIFIDTSAFYALLDRSDANHSQARALWFELLDSEQRLFTSNYVVVESCALAQTRLGVLAVRLFQDEILPLVNISWVDEQLHQLAVTAMMAAARRKVSLVDYSSVALMRKMGGRVAFAFDEYFEEEGFGQAMV